jgi:GTPase
MLVEKESSLLAEKIISGDRAALGRAMSIVESSHPKHQTLAFELLNHAEKVSNESIRIGITGVPGVGKSTFIESLGEILTKSGQKVAVLAIDPSSSLSGGSILGDKTRMENLSHNPNAFVRPSPSSGTLGGVTKTTRDLILLSELAGYDTILIETVGAGQSETEVQKLTDLFLLMLLPSAGDELQGIKKGVVELADLIVINKADGDRINAAKMAMTSYKHAIRILSTHSEIMICSALESTGIDEVWGQIKKQIKISKGNNRFIQKRQEQDSYWLEKIFKDMLIVNYFSKMKFNNNLLSLSEVRKQIARGEITFGEALRLLSKSVES